MGPQKNHLTDRTRVVFSETGRTRSNEAGRSMPSKKQYNLVHNDEYDTRIPLHSEEAFHRGIVFHAKVIYHDLFARDQPYLVIIIDHR